MPSLETLLNIEDEVNAVLNDLGIPDKLSEMDDFMNQNDLKVNITNENAVTTGLVTYTCTVKDKDNNALANRVVEWYEGTTLVGLDATDSNGISTFTKKVTTANIYDVHAVVRGTHAGDDIRMFVKEKDNLLTYNIWSGGDYTKQITSSEYTKSSTNSVSLSEDYSSIGDYSIEVDHVGETAGWVRFSIPELPESLLGKTVTFSGKIYAPSGTPYLKIYLRHDSTTIVEQGLSINSNTEFTSFSVSATISDATVNSIQFNFSILESIYLDNLVAKIA